MPDIVALLVFRTWVSSTARHPEGIVYSEVRIGIECERRAENICVGKSVIEFITRDEVKLTSIGLDHRWRAVPDDD